MKYGSPIRQPVISWKVRNCFFLRGIRWMVIQSNLGTLDLEVSGQGGPRGIMGIYLFEYIWWPTGHPPQQKTTFQTPDSVKLRVFLMCFMQVIWAFIRSVEVFLDVPGRKLGLLPGKKPCHLNMNSWKMHFLLK